ncbi:DUF7563 family protein [Natronorubrum sp. FCH18a]|uniref:DUF7563 family protein n=1 Tax=Natronorubrum sp. FCH18a TaxID=3447018 RepID=UPI003F51A8AC
MPACEDCGAHVSERFTAVFGDDAHVVYACPACSDMAHIVRGGAATDAAFAARVRGDEDDSKK